MKGWANNLESRWTATLQKSRFGRWLLRTAFGRFIARYFWVYIVYRIIKWPAIALITIMLGSKAPGFLAWFSPSEKSNAATPQQSGDSTMDTQPKTDSFVKVGDSAPDFSLPLFESGKEPRDFTLSELRGKTVVLYFYPMDDTPGCTAQACGLRDAHSEIADQGAVVIGVSADDLESHASFAAKFDLPFALLVDEDGKVREAYGNPDGSTPPLARTTYIIDAEGVVRHITGAGAKVEDHLAESLDWVKKLSSPTGHE